MQKKEINTHGQRNISSDIESMNRKGRIQMNTETTLKIQRE